METLHSKILGKGKPLLILHGFLGMSDNWKTLGNQFSKNGFEVHLIDQRNHGKSFHSEDFDYVFLSNDIQSYMGHHGIDRTSIIGHSMGGKTAMQLAVSHPELITKLLVADIAPKYYPPHHQYIVDGLAQLDFDQTASRKEADETLAQYLPEPGIRQFLLKNLYWVEPGRLGFKFNFGILKDRLDEIGENINPTASFNGATLFLRGDRSEYILPNDYEQIKKHFPNAEIDSVANAGHWLHAENPSQFFEKALRFLKE